LLLARQLRVFLELKFDSQLNFEDFLKGFEYDLIKNVFF